MKNVKRTFYVFSLILLISIIVHASEEKKQDIELQFLIALSQKNVNYDEIKKLSENTDFSKLEVSDSHPLYRAIDFRNAQAVKIIVGNGKNIDINTLKDKDGYPPLLYAATMNSNDKDTLLTLLELGADPNSLYPEGRTILVKYLIMEPPDIEFIRVLLKYGVDPNIFSKNRMPPIVLVSKKYDVVRLLLEHGADPNIIYSDGEGYTTPLITATETSNIEGVKLLLEFGADKYKQDSKGKMPIDYVNEDRVYYDHFNKPLSPDLILLTELLK